MCVRCIKWEKETVEKTKSTILKLISSAQVDEELGTPKEIETVEIQ